VASANLALAEAVKSEQSVKIAEQVAKAERERQVTLVLASQDAERQAIGVKVSASTEKEASEAKAEAIRTLRDSRFREVGFVPRNHTIGRAVKIVGEPKLPYGRPT
jgi:hypothetical protein